MWKVTFRRLHLVVPVFPVALRAPVCQLLGPVVVPAVVPMAVASAVRVVARVALFRHASATVGLPSFVRH